MKNININNFGEDKLGLTFLEVSQYLKIRSDNKKVGQFFRKFIQWIGGQTGPVLDNGEFGYFRHDVERFADLVLEEKLTYFD